MPAGIFSRTALRDAAHKGIQSGRLNFPVMVALLAAMAGFVFAYYFWPTGKAWLSWYADWQRAGGQLRAGLASGLAGGVLSELGVVYIRDRGRWNLTHLENMAYRFVVFFVGGFLCYKFYEFQAYWFGDGLSLSVILPKIFVDQFVWSVFWATPYQTSTFRLQTLRFSLPKLWRELDGRFVVERMLPVMITNWMFWIPGVVLVYSVPLALQMPMNVFATAIWSLLLAGLATPATVEDDPMSEPLVP